MDRTIRGWDDRADSALVTQASIEAAVLVRPPRQRVAGIPAPSRKTDLHLAKLSGST
jgi:hypothetical protein